MNKRRLLYFIRNYRFQSLFIRNLGLIFLLTVLPFAGTAIVVFQQMNEIVQEEISAANLSSLHRVRDVVDTSIEQTDLMATKLSLLPGTERLIYSSEPEETFRNVYNSILVHLSMMTSIYDYIDSIYLYSERNGYVVTGQTGLPVSQLKDQTWLPHLALRQNNDPFVIPRKFEDKYPFYITLVRPMYIYDEERKGAVLVNIDMEEFAKTIMRKRDDKEGRFFIVDGSGTILLSDYPSDFMEPYHTRLLLRNVELTEGSRPLRVDGQEYIMSAARSHMFDWVYISMLPIQHYREKTEDLHRFMIAFGLAGIVVILAVTFVLSVRTFAPVRMIMSAFDDPQSKLPEEQKHAEIRYILGHISKYLFTKKELENELERRIDLLNQARSVALQSQINPHFLFNTLDTVKWMAIRLTKGDNEVSHMVSLLSELMRLSMSGDGHLVPLRQEIEHAGKYLDILRHRYRDKIQVHWNLPEPLLECKIVQLTLQPLIENAVRHGMKPKRHTGNIWIEAKSIGSNLIIEVRDDGAGIPPDVVERLNRDLHEEATLTGQHIGLRNVNHRIRLIFGSNYGVTIASDGQTGTTVTIWLPMAL